jgi:hypothetical protein
MKFFKIYISKIGLIKSINLPAQIFESLRGTFPLSRMQYEDSDKVPKRKYKKGDKVRYKTFHAASGMDATSRVEKGEEQVGRITQRKKGYHYHFKFSRPDQYQ